MIDYNVQLLPIDSSIAPYIRRFVYAEAKVKEPFDQPFYPIGYVKIPFTLKGKSTISIKDKKIIRQVVDDGPYFSGIIAGDNAHMHFKEDLHFIWVELKAGMGHYLFHLDMTNLVNTTTHFSNVSDIANAFNNDVIQARNNLEDVIKIYEQFIKDCAVNRLPSVPYIDQAVQIIESYNGNITVQEIMDRVHIPVSEKQFVRNFKKIVGLSPKRWCRVRQLGYIMELIEKGENFTNIALESGFYDQAHFNHSFQEFVQLSPKRFIEDQETDFIKFWLKLSK